MILDRLDVPVETFEAMSGWTIKPEGACRGGICVPLGDSVDSVDRGNGGDGDAPAFDLTAVADRLRMPIVHDAEHGLYALGPASVTGRALATAEAPELVLPDLDGTPFRLSSLLGQKVVVVAWAPY